MESSKELLILGFATQQDWEAWLVEHYADPTGIWLKIAKKATGTQSISYTEALEGALCYGWIDGQKAALDERFWLQKFTPRGPRSRWSQINRDKATELLGQGRMQPAGLAEVERARQDGRWEAAYEPQSRATVPEALPR